MENSPTGFIDLPLFANDVGLTFSKSNGEIVHSINLGSQDKGLVGFSWTDIPDEIKKKNKINNSGILYGNAEGSDGLSTTVYNKVIATSTQKIVRMLFCKTKVMVKSLLLKQ